MEHTIVSLAQRPDLGGAADQVIAACWAPFSLEDDTADRYWDPMVQRFAAFQLVLLDDQDQAVGVANSIPVAWDGSLENLPDGWGAALERGIQSPLPPTALTAMSVSILPERRGEGLSRRMLEELRALAKRPELAALIAPVRPTLKSRYPLTPMERYAAWTREDGSPFDPWLRVHWREGGEQIGIAPRSMCVSGTVAQWEEWASMRFPESGRYVVPEALQPVEIDREADLGRYLEANVWVLHRL